MAQSFKSYLNNNAPFINARNTWQRTAGEATVARQKWESTKETDPNYAQILAAYKTAQTKADDAKRDMDAAESRAKTAFDAKKEKQDLESKKKKDAPIQTQINTIEDEILKYENAGLPVPADKQQQLKDLQNKLSVPPTEVKKDTTDKVDYNVLSGTVRSGAPAVTELSFEEFIKGIDADPKLLAKVRADLGIRSTDPKLDIATYQALLKKEQEIITLSGIRGPIDRLTYLAETRGKGVGTGGISLTISNPTQADAYINSAFKSELGRDATASELEKYRKILNTAEEKNPTKTVNGRTVGGLNREQFLKGEIAKLPEFTKKKTDKAGLTTQSILETAKANGITLAPDQINSFTKQVVDGTDIKVIQSQIRSIAANGMPDNVKKLLNEGVDLETVYAPYKNLMASVLELNPESIDLKDPTLRLAFGPDKETTIYDFEKALRKDYRWQYTNNAKRDVSNVALKVLQDFGFQA